MRFAKKKQDFVGFLQLRSKDLQWGVKVVICSHSSEVKEPDAGEESMPLRCFVRISLSESQQTGGQALISSQRSTCRLSNVVEK